VFKKKMGDIAARSKKYDWSNKGIEEVVEKLSKNGGNHVFSTDGMPYAQAQSFWSAVSNRARVLSLNTDGTKRHRTHKMETGDILLEVSKRV
jgi:hypothetical protein